MNNKIFSIVIFALFLTTFMSCEKEPKETVLTEAVYQGENDMAWAIAHYVEYPKEEIEFNRAGIVRVSFVVDEKGNVNQIEVAIDEKIKTAQIAVARKKLDNKDVLPLNFSVLESLIKSVEKLNFQPALKNGKPVISIVTTSVEFMLI